MLRLSVGYSTASFASASYRYRDRRRGKRSTSCRGLRGDRINQLPDVLKPCDLRSGEGHP